MKKAWRFAILFLLPAVLLFSQSLVEVSKKEQERREKLKGKNAKVITNADLKSVKKAPAVTIQDEPSAGTESAAPPRQDNRDTRQTQRVLDRRGASSFATAVLPDTILVENSELALYTPDGRYADIYLLGSLELEVDIQNRPGDDLIIHSRLGGSQDISFDEEGLSPAGTWGYLFEGFWYGVLAVDEGEDWQELGRGTGTRRAQEFDLGGLTRAKKIKIIFKPHNNAQMAIRMNQIEPAAIVMGIDAVEALH